MWPILFNKIDVQAEAAKQAQTVERQGYQFSWPIMYTISILYCVCVSVGFLILDLVAIDPDIFCQSKVSVRHIRIRGRPKKFRPPKWRLLTKPG